MNTEPPVTVPDVTFGPEGLAPVVVQDAADGRVLMVAYMDAEALGATLETGDVHFHSRSRDRLWRKGETSGNVLRLVSLATDCDGDALLVTVDPVGPDVPPRHPVVLRPRRRPRPSHPDVGTARRAGRDPGLRLAGDPVGDDRLAGGGPTCRLVHDEPSRRGCRRGRPQGHRGGHRDAARGQGRRRTRQRPRPVTRWPARPRTCCTTRWCCWRSAASPPPTVIAALRERHGR